jgi:hypothetical protein
MAATELDVTGLWGDDPQATAEEIEQFINDNMMQDGGLWAIEDWNESTLQVFLYMKLLEAGVNVRFEKGRKRRADLFVIDGDRRIVLELKYAQVHTVVMPDGPAGETKWQLRDRRQEFIENKASEDGGLWAMRYKPWNKLPETTLRQFLIERDAKKNKDTYDQLKATDMYMIVGVGHVLAVEKLEF